MTEEELEQLLASSPLNKHLQPPELPAPARPPLALGTDHIALMIASGNLDGVVGGPEPHVRKGATKKVQYLREQTETETETKTVYAEKPQLTIRVLTADGIIHTLE